MITPFRKNEHHGFLSVFKITRKNRIRWTSGRDLNGVNAANRRYPPNIHRISTIHDICPAGGVVVGRRRRRRDTYLLGGPLEAGDDAVLDLVQVLDALRHVDDQVRAGAVGAEAPDLARLRHVKVVLVHQVARALLQVLTRRHGSLRQRRRKRSRSRGDPSSRSHGHPSAYQRPSLCDRAHKVVSRRGLKKSAEHRSCKLPRLIYNARVSRYFSAVTNARPPACPLHAVPPELNALPPHALQQCSCFFIAEIEVGFQTIIN